MTLSKFFQKHHESIKEGRQRLERLRVLARKARTKAQIDVCVNVAIDMGMDPL
jgi:hypothetical protein